MSVNGKGLAATSIGVLFVWSGIKGWSVLGTVKDVIAGVKPNQPVLYPLSGSLNSDTVSGVVGSVGGIAGIASEYLGHAYRFGGAPGKDGASPWDCSSFVNYVVGKRLGHAIPGYSAGKYDGSVHGPTTAQWAIWPGLTRVSEAEVTNGDIIVWSGHMGIAVDNTHMISAQNEQDKTRLTPIAGNGNGPLLIRGRLNG